MIKEKWMPIEGFEAYYEVSDMGEVRSSENKNRYRPNQKSVILKKHLSTYGYYQVTLSVDGVRFLKRVNRLVATAFVPNPEMKPVVNHVKGIKTDNRATQLEWATFSENELHSYRVLGKSLKGVKKYTKGQINTKAKPVICHETREVYKSIKDAAKKLSVHPANISKQIKGELKTTGGYTFAHKVTL